MVYRMAVADSQDERNYIGPVVEPVVDALRTGGDVDTGDVRSALALLPRYLVEVQRLVIASARAPEGDRNHRMTWREIGAALGFPADTAAQRAIMLARKLDLLPPATPRSTTD
jgi:hypothetical protein